MNFSLGWTVVVLGLLLASCDRSTQPQVVTAAECDLGVSKRHIQQLLNLLSEYGVSKPEDEQRFLRKLGGPSFPLVSPGCYGVTFTDILQGVIPGRMISFDRSPFETEMNQAKIIEFYSGLLQAFASATTGEWSPLGVEVEYVPDKELVKIKFSAFSDTYRWRVDQHEALDRVGDEFFDQLVRLEVEKLSGMYFDLSKGRDKRFAYLPKNLVPELRRLGIQ